MSVRRTKMPGPPWSADGWVAAGETWTYGSADDPTYTFTISGDLTGKYSPGMRVRLSQTTGGTKYFLITKVDHSGGTTTVTVYGGTDYDLANETIASPNYSVVKAPVGFPLDPNKWTVTYTDTTRRTLGSAPTTNVWYNLASQSMSIPLGVWDVQYQMSPWATAPTNIECALSTGSSSVSDQDLVGLIYVNPAAESSGTTVARKTLSLTAKTTYYPIVRTQGSATNIGFLNDWASMIVRAVCAYL